MSDESQESQYSIRYTNPIYGEEEIAAVVEALRTEPDLQVGPRVREMERRVAAMFDKKHGIMTNSGTSALYLAVELLDLPPGSEIITSIISFSATFAPIVRGGFVASYVDVEFDTYNIDVDKIEEMITPNTRAMLIPNLIGNAPDWERIREIADRHDLKVIEDSADTLGAELRGKTTGTWTDISMTSFARSHIITSGGSGGLVAVNSEEEWDRALLLRRWGRTSEVQMYGSKQGSGDRFEAVIDGIPYDTYFIFDEVGWNFEPSEMHAAFGLVQLGRLEEFYEARKRRFDLHTEFFNLERIREAIRARAAAGGAEDELDLLPADDPRGCGLRPARVPAVHGEQGCPDAHGLVRQHPPPTRVQGHRPQGCSRGLPERRPRDGVRSHPPDEPRRADRRHRADPFADRRVRQHALSSSRRAGRERWPMETPNTTRR